MARAPLDRVLHQIRHWLGQRAGTGQSDGALLESFIQQQDQSAFETLVRRHGTMVLDVCRCRLANEHDAEDAFQATFLVLARQAASIRQRESLGSWLYGVAHRTALRARSNAARRKLHENQAMLMLKSNATPEADGQELRRLLHEELERLPEKYRAPLVLCCLQGKTNAEAAAELGWPKGTVQVRIARGRDRLRQRLAGRGVVLSLTALTAALTPAARAVPPALLTETIQAAAALAAGQSISSATAAVLAEEVSQMMRTSKLKIVTAVVLAVGLTGAGGSLLLDRAPAAKPAANEAAELVATPAPVQPVAALDLYGDPLPPGAVVRLGTSRFRHPYSAASVAYSPDGRLLVSWNGHVTVGTIRLWDAQTGQAMPLDCKHVGSVDAAAFSPDGKFLAAASYDTRPHPSEARTEVILWELATGQEVRRLSTTLPRAGLPGRITAMAFAPDGKTLAAAGENPQRQPGNDGPALWLWELATGKERQRISGLSGWVRCLAFSADGQALISVSSGDGVRWWDVATGQPQRQVKVQGLDQNMLVALSPDAKLLAWAKPDASFSVRLWDLTRDKEVRQLRHPNAISALTFSPDGKTLATSAANRGVSGGTLRFWDPATGQELRQAADTVNFYTLFLAFSPDGKTVASCGSESAIRRWDVATGNELLVGPGHRAQVSNVFFSPDSQTVITTGDGTLRIWEAATGKQLHSLQHDWSPYADMALAPDGQSIAVVDGGFVGLGQLRTGKVIREWKKRPGDMVPPNLNRFTPAHIPQFLAFSPDGKYLTAGSWTRTLSIWEVATGKEHQVLQAAKGPIMTVAFSADSKSLATANDETIGFWDLATGKQVREVPGPKGSVLCMVFAPDGTLRATGVQGQTLDLWTGGAAGPPVSRLLENVTNASINAQAFSADGKTLATGGGVPQGLLRLWETASGAEQRQFIVPSSPPNKLIFAPDGKTVATASGDGFVLIWRCGQPGPAAQ